VRILHVISGSTPYYGGPGLAFRSICHKLVRQGVEVELATTNANGKGDLAVPLNSPIDEDGVATWYFARQTREYTVSMPLATWLRQNVTRFDLVHMQSLFLFSTTVSSWICHHHVPYVISPQGTLMKWALGNRRSLLKRVSIRIIESRCLNNASLIHYTSQQEQEESQAIGISTANVIIPLPVDVDCYATSSPSGWLRSKYPELRSRQIILFLARIHPVKGLDLLLRAFATACQANPDLALVIAGGGEPNYEAHLRNEVRELGLEADVWFVGWLEQAGKRGAFLDSDLFVLTSQMESFGVSAAEAMACGLPVILSDQVAIHREVAQSEAGLVVPCKVQPLADALLRLSQDASLRHRMGLNGQACARKRFSLSAVTTALVQAYRSVLAQ